MRPAHYTPPTMIQIGPDVLARCDGGEEWSLATDDPELELRKKEWDHFDAAEFQPTDLQIFVQDLKKTA